MTIEKKTKKEFSLRGGFPVHGKKRGHSFSRQGRGDELGVWNRGRGKKSYSTKKKKPPLNPRKRGGEKERRQSKRKEKRGKFHRPDRKKGGGKENPTCGKKE